MYINIKLSLTENFIIFSRGDLLDYFLSIQDIIEKNPANIGNFASRKRETKYNVKVAKPCHQATMKQKT